MTLIKAAINGGHPASAHPAQPTNPAAIATAARSAIAAGADVVHAHARDAGGAESIAPEAVGAMVRAVREADPSIIVGTTTGLWTCSGHAERMRLLESWPADALPDFASAAFREEGAAEAAEAVLERGMELEVAVWSMEDVPALLAAPALERSIRILIEPEEEKPGDALRTCRAIAERLRAEGLAIPLLYHGFDATVWPLVRAAIADGAEVRVGFEDGFTLENGEIAADNAALVRAARALAEQENAPAPLP